MTQLSSQKGLSKLLKKLDFDRIFVVINAGMLCNSDGRRIIGTNDLDRNY